jgi:hypothetical protein
MRASEFQPSKLVIFDIDDTLVHTQTKVHVVQNGQVVKSLNSHEFTHYKLQPGEQFDFGDFRNAHEFFHNSKPIIPMLDQLKHDIATGNKVVMVTARADFDDKELFLDTFRKYGVNMSKVHVYRAGNMAGKMQTEEKKKIIIRELLNKGNYTKAIMYDDAVPNLKSFVELKKEYPHTKFYAWHVSLEGEASEYHRTNEMKVNELITEKWTQKYKSSINCSHPKGFSQKAHCAGKKKHNEDITMEAVCPDCGMCETHGNLNEIKKGVKDSNGVTKCWPGKHAEGTKKGKNGGQVRNCVPNESQGVAEAFDRPSAVEWETGEGEEAVDAIATLDDGTYLSIMFSKEFGDYGDDLGDWSIEFHRNNSQEVSGEGDAQRVFATVLEAIRQFVKKYKANTITFSASKAPEPEMVKPGANANPESRAKLYNRLVQRYAGAMGYSATQREGNGKVTYTLRRTKQGVAEDWNKVNHHDKTDGLSQKAVNAYRREHPGSKLKTAVTTKPSKLKPGSKAAKRRKSFCARMSGNKGPMKKPNGKPTPKALALRRWNCESVEEMQQLIQLGETYINNIKEKMMPSSTFTGSKKNKINGKGMLRNGPAKPGDLVGGS